MLHCIVRSQLVITRKCLLLTVNRVTGGDRRRRNFKQLFFDLAAACGLDPEKESKLPSVHFKGDKSSAWGEKNWDKKVSRTLVAVLKGRHVSQIYHAMVRIGVVEDLHEYPAVQRAASAKISKTMQDHWSARLSVHLWERLNLSRSECETQRHLLSFKYHPAPRDVYEPLLLWQNPTDPEDCVPFPILPGRYAREREHAAIAADTGTVVDAFGSCQRDARVAASELYSAYKEAMRSNFSDARPAQPVFMFDGTGQSLGKGLCHAELGSADFYGKVRQSRQTLQPLQASEGNDHAVSIRETMEFTATKFNALIAVGEIVRDDGVRIPAKPIASADFQAVKALTATAEQSHSVWCRCQESTQHLYCREAIECELCEDSRVVEAAFTKMIAYIETAKEGPKCKYKTFDDQCKWNHFSPGVARGASFTRFKCDRCGYNPTEKQWRKDLADFSKLSDAEQKQRRKIHREVGVPVPEFNRHYFGELFMAPMIHLDFQNIGADMLHLLYLNAFKHLFNYTVHQPMPGASQRRLIPGSLHCANC